VPGDSNLEDIGSAREKFRQKHPELGDEQIGALERELVGRIGVLEKYYEALEDAYQLAHDLPQEEFDLRWPKSDESQRAPIREESPVETVDLRQEAPRAAPPIQTPPTEQQSGIPMLNQPPVKEKPPEEPVLEPSDLPMEAPLVSSDNPENLFSEEGTVPPELSNILKRMNKTPLRIDKRGKIRRDVIETQIKQDQWSREMDHFKPIVDLLSKSPTSIQMLGDKYAEGESSPYFLVRHILLNSDILDLDSKTTLYRVLENDKNISLRELNITDALEMTRSMASMGIPPVESVLYNYDRMTEELLTQVKTLTALAMMQQHHLEEKAPDFLKVTIPKENLIDEIQMLRKDIVKIFKEDIKESLAKLEIEPDAINGYMRANIGRMETVYLQAVENLADRVKVDLKRSEQENAKNIILNMLAITKGLQLYKEEIKVYLLLRDHLLEGLARVDFEWDRIPDSHGLTVKQLYIIMRYQHKQGGKNVLARCISSLMKQKLIRNVGLGRISLNFKDWSFLYNTDAKTEAPQEDSRTDVS